MNIKEREGGDSCLPWTASVITCSKSSSPPCRSRNNKLYDDYVLQHFPFLSGSPRCCIVFFRTNCKIQQNSKFTSLLISLSFLEDQMWQDARCWPTCSMQNFHLSHADKCSTHTIYINNRKIYNFKLKAKDFCRIFPWIHINALKKKKFGGILPLFFTPVIDRKCGTRAKCFTCIEGVITWCLSQTTCHKDALS